MLNEYIPKISKHYECMIYFPDYIQKNTENHEKI